MLYSRLRASRGSAVTVIKYYIRYTYSGSFLPERECTRIFGLKAYSIYVHLLSGEISTDYRVITYTSLERDLYENNVAKWCKVGKFEI